MTEFRRNLPDKYQYYFTGTQDWGLEKKIQLEFSHPLDDPGRISPNCI